RAPQSAAVVRVGRRGVRYVRPPTTLTCPGNRQSTTCSSCTAAKPASAESDSWACTETPQTTDAAAAAHARTLTSSRSARRITQVVAALKNVADISYVTPSLSNVMMLLFIARSIHR